MSKDLIDAGLDYMIYSFDGGSKETYEKMRPDVSKNSFDKVYNNILISLKLKKKKEHYFLEQKYK